MKDIRIFVASSKELEKERNYLAFLVLAKEDEFAAFGLRVRLAKWEYVDPKMTEARTEDRYLDEMYNCDAALVLFRDIAGMYTREELDKALAKEGASRLKTHQILFAAEGKPDSDATKLRESLPTDSYGVWSGIEELGAAFLSLVDKVAQCEGLVEAPEETLRTVSAFLAADDELAADRNAFADTILNLNDILARRGIRVKMRFYDATQHREMLESSEMALVLYHTNCNAFGPDQMHDAYERTKREENPKRLYVFFRDENDAELDKAFVDFKNGFVEHLGHFFCRFENADTLKLNFLLSLETVLGEGSSFVKLDGRKVKADELVVGELTKLPMVANNGGLNDLLNRAEQATAEFKSQQEICKSNPSDDSAYVKLLSLSKRKNDLDSQVEKEMSRSFDLAKRMAAVSANEANETILQARLLLDEGKIGDAVELLDGASSEIDDVLGDIAGLEDLMEQKLKALEAWIEVELFRADTVLAYAKEAFAVRFAKAEGIFKSLFAKVERALTKGRPIMLAKILRRFAKLYDEINDSLKPIPLLEKAIECYERIGDKEQFWESAMVKVELARYHRANRCENVAERYCLEALETFSTLSLEVTGEKAECILDLCYIHKDLNQNEIAYAEFLEATDLFRKLSDRSVYFRKRLAWVLEGLAYHCMRMKKMSEARNYFEMSLELSRTLVEMEPKVRGSVARSLIGCANLYMKLDDFERAKSAWTEALAVYRELAAENPDSSCPDLAWALSKIGFSMDAAHVDLQVEFYKESFGIYERLQTYNPAKYEYSAAKMKRSLANALGRQSCYQLSIIAFKEAIARFEKLSTDNWGRFGVDLLKSYDGLLSVYIKNSIEDIDMDILESAIYVAKKLLETNGYVCKQDGVTLLNKAIEVYLKKGLNQKARLLREELSRYDIQYTGNKYKETIVSDWKFADSFQPCLEALDGSPPSSFDEYVKYLISHPLFTISQKSHELFHSGMLAWMMKEYPIFVGAFFKDSYIDWSQARVTVETEMEHRDITIILDGEMYVIENKFKSFFAIEQLQKYQDELIIQPNNEDYDEYGSTQSRMKAGVVLGVGDYTGKWLPSKWDYLSYYKLLPNLWKRFQEIKSGVKESHCNLIQNYLEFLDALLSVISPFGTNLGETQWMSSNDIPPSLSKHGLADFIKQMLAHSLGEYFMFQYRSQLDDSNGSVLIDCPYNYRGDPKIVFKICPWDSSNPMIFKVSLVGDTITKRFGGWQPISHYIEEWMGDKKCHGSIAELSKILFEEVNKVESLIPIAFKELGCVFKCKTETRRII